MSLPQPGPEQGADSLPPAVQDGPETPSNPSTGSSPGQVNAVPQLEYQAAALSQEHMGKVAFTGQGRGVSRRMVRPTYAKLPEYQRILEAANRRFRSSADAELGASIAAEWMLDNAYIVLQALREVEQDLPPDFYGELPVLTGGILQGYPRIYVLAHDLIQHENAALEVDRLRRYVHAYQTGESGSHGQGTANPLTMGELWALPAMLRLGIIENLAACTGEMTGQLARKTVGLSGRLFPPGVPIKDLKADQLVANCVLSLRLLGSHDWKEFFEDASLVEQVLHDDPAGIYHRMDFETRDRYRKVVERLARQGGLEEAEVARQAIELARKAASTGNAEGVALSTYTGDSSAFPSTSSNENLNPGSGLFAVKRSAHVGYYLVDQGRPALVTELRIQPETGVQMRTWLDLHAAYIYLGAIGFITALLAAAAGWAAASAGSPGLGALALLTFLIPAMTAAVDAVNWVVTHVVRPKRLPKMDFSKGIPAEARTLVAVPAMLGSPAQVEALLQQLELHYLRNPEAALGFALVTDFSDASEQYLQEDDALLQQAAAGVKALNQHYSNQFFLLNRSRKWNPTEGVWMGWERKRGKLHELNQLILGHGDEGFSTQVGELAFLKGVRYVITLDEDTILPKDAAGRLVAAMAHPLNRAGFNAQGDVTAGYTVLQPRTEINPVSANRTPFIRLFSGPGGLDLYTLAVSDVYQDLFREGSYVGKGIYDVAAFERSLAGQVPENALLSHDLIEGILGRAALVTDILLVEDFPANYLVYARRQARWVRGDWQLLPWLAGLPYPMPPSPRRLSAISRWKIFDNLRRSLAEPALLLYYLVAWLWLPGNPLWWTLAGVASLGLPALAALWETVRIAAGHFIVRWLPFLRRGQEEGDQSTSFVTSLTASAAHWGMALAFLPFQALLHLQAILLTLWRLFITRQHMLRWTTSAQATRRMGEELSPGSALTRMGASLLLAGSITALLALFRPPALLPAAPLLLIWLVSPWIASRISQPRRERVQPLTSEQVRRLQSLARLTWLFFERFVGPEDHWLPPDHFQEAPLGMVAHRTSPTNIGLMLVSTLAAYDLGYVDLLNLGARVQSSLETLQGLEHYRGHPLNWIDTRSLAPLQPRYVSTVDSGNLAACLISLAQGLKAMPDRSLLRPENFSGLLDCLNPVVDLVEAQDLSPELHAPVMKVKGQLSEFMTQTKEAGSNLAGWPNLLKHLAGPGWEALDTALIELLEASAGTLGTEVLGRLRLTTRMLHDQIDNSLREINHLAPWLALMANPPELFSNPDLDALVTKTWIALQETLRPGLCLGELEAASRTAQRQVEEMQDRLRLLQVSTGGGGNGHPPASNQAGETSSAQAVAGRIDQALDWAARLEKALQDGGEALQPLLEGFARSASLAEAAIQEMDFRFLYDHDRQVLHIGYNVDSGKLDANYYDLMASEARLTSLVAIAKGDLPQRHWLHLARPLTQVAGQRVLLSWSGTMFEYLMPNLLAPSYAGTLLAQSAEGAVWRQIQYGQEKEIPWGISESGYYRFDSNQFYQYRAFGVPGLGFKRGAGEDLVITPYASLLALNLAPQAVAKNLEALRQAGLDGAYGMYESVDYGTNPSEGRGMGENEGSLVRSFMAHHQGMIFISVANYFTGMAAVQRFHADPRIRAVELLLQERISPDAPLEKTLDEDVRPVRPTESNRVGSPWRVRLQAPQPRLHYLSNGRYGVMVTSAGSGYSTWQELDLTRWREDTTRSNWGTWIYIMDEESGDLWSVGYQPTNLPATSREAYFNAHMVELHRRDYDIAVAMEITVPPGEDLEVRMVSLTNHSSRKRRLRLVSYGEVVLAKREDDRRHPAFNKLFIESEYSSEVNALLFKRRPRTENETPISLGHALVVGEGMTPSRAYESDRMRFLGRSHTSRAPWVFSHHAPAAAQKPASPSTGSPQAERDKQNLVLQKLGVKMLPAQTISGSRLRGAGIPVTELGLDGTIGGTLDPIFALGQAVELEPHASCQVAFLTIAASRKEDVLAMARRYQSWPVIKRAFEQARQAAEVELRQLGLDIPQLRVIERLLSLMLYPHPVLRASPERLASNTKGQSGLWPFAISGDYPILLVKMKDAEELGIVQDALLAHAYWRNRKLKIDLVILNEMGSDYGQELNRQVHSLMQRTGSEDWLSRRGGIFLLMSDQMQEAERVLLDTTARAILEGDKGSLETQLECMAQLPPRLPIFVPPLPEDEVPAETPLVERPANLLYDNGLGGFSPDGKEYLIYLQGNETTPAPWVNVIANNPDFGFLVSESGSGPTWSLNSGENRLTPWHNDPVCDQPGEVVYLRDEETGALWSPTPLPMREKEPYLVRHGAGYSRFEHNSHGLKQILTLFAAGNDPVKVVRLRLENTWDHTRRITATFYVEWVLGVHRDSAKMFVVPEYDGETQALLARNAYNNEFGGRVAFSAASEKLHGLTADRTEFLGRLGGLYRPAALTRIGLGSSVTAGSDPCAALQLHLDLPSGQAQEVYFLLGEADDREEALRLVKLYQQPGEVERAWKEVEQTWDELLGAVQVSTPDPAMDLMLNRWLLYQAVSCRLWGRTAFYQSSGAYGFRDQLQDALALSFSDTQQLREQILRTARRQFEEGDVLHWWHPPSGRGVRTRISDDLLWLPYAAAEYIKVTGDEAILDEAIPFIKAPVLEPGEDERYNPFPDETAPESLYAHCMRALKKGATTGPHGLPLIGSGDWNDGLNRVGKPAFGDDKRPGRGESTWLGWFLIETIHRFAPIMDQRGDGELAHAYREKAEQYRQALESNGWDGAWYLRAFYDDGSPLGSASRKECQIDSIAQSWAVISGAGEAGRRRQAMDSVLQRLVNWDEGLALLLTPPFNRSARDPGYIKGYLPGIRENGGQYTHAATWVAWALAGLGEGDTAGRLFQLLNPISHSSDPQAVQKYRVEPYQIAADVYSQPPHVGHGGWTGYTGSAGWMYRLGVERLLGLNMEGDSLRFDPCIPQEWKGYHVTLKHCGSVYQITVENPEGVCQGVKSIELDGQEAPGNRLKFVDDGQAHTVRVILSKDSQ